MDWYSAYNETGTLLLKKMQQAQQYGDTFVNRDAKALYRPVLCLSRDSER